MQKGTEIMQRIENIGASRVLRAGVLTLGLAASFVANAQDSRGAPGNPPLAQTPSQSQEACQARLREYRASVECFGRFRTTTGGVRPEAFQHCKEVPQPQGCHYSETSTPPTRYIDPATPR